MYLINLIYGEKWRGVHQNIVAVTLTWIRAGVLGSDVLG